MMDWPIIVSAIFWWLIMGYLVIKIHRRNALTKKEIDEVAEMLVKATYIKTISAMGDVGLNRYQRSEVLAMVTDIVLAEKRELSEYQRMQINSWKSLGPVKAKAL